MLDAATTIVLKHGLEHLTIARLATQLDMATGAMYRYFSSKSSLISALERRAAVALAIDLAAAADAAVSAAPDAPADLIPLIRVFAIARSYLRMAKRQPQRHRLVDATLSTPKLLLDEAGARQVADVIDTLLQQVAVPIAEAAALGVIRPADPLSRTYILWAAVHGFDHLRKRDRTQPLHLRAAALIEAASIDLLRGWGASEAVIDALLAALRAS